MNSFKRAVLMGLGIAALAAAQDNAAQRVTVPFRDASAPRKLEVTLLMGSVTVRGYDGRDAVVEYTGRAVTPNRRGGTPPPGMHRIGGSGGLDITEDNNVVRVSNNAYFGSGSDLVIQVPVQTSVTVKTMTGGNLVVENISGDIEAQNMNGQVTVNNVSGSVVAHSMNGKVTASLNRVDPDKSMNFSTFNGEIDVTLPADTKAGLKMRADNGDIFTDFDVKMDSATPVVEDEKSKSKSNKVRRRVRVDSAVRGTINGGGPELQFTTYNGRILIHKK